METEYNKEVEKMLFLIDQLQKTKMRILEIQKKKSDPTKPKSGDKKSPNLHDRIDWSKPWKAIIGPIRMPAKNFWDFEKRYFPRATGPTKFIEWIICHLMESPENRNFYMKSKRCYVFKDNKWEQISTKKFFPQLKKKILEQYCDILLRSQTKRVDPFAKDCLSRCSLKHWTNLFLEEMFAGINQSVHQNR